MNSTPFFRDIQVAIRYNISRPTLWRWVRQGKFPRPIKLGQGTSRWKATDLETWEQKQANGEGENE